MPGSQAATATRAGSSFHPLRSRPFRLYFGGQVVPVSGSFLRQTSIDGIKHGTNADFPWTVVRSITAATPGAHLAMCRAVRLAV